MFHGNLTMFDVPIPRELVPADLHGASNQIWLIDGFRRRRPASLESSSFHEAASAVPFSLKIE
jgi:hypothetical protein